MLHYLNVTIICVLPGVLENNGSFFGTEIYTKRENLSLLFRSMPGIIYKKTGVMIQTAIIRPVDYYQI
ncbi:hypothetical protein A4D02_27525 [Niastella koreensis]|uniref:Uncharacterized protein n=1 Tax=Niastella koreensis TaxID=354356 RepID=A0ABX3NZU1_9BACT|nr:hypothetical protein A4D02_27525 [Niastella koreensis]